MLSKHILFGYLILLLTAGVATAQVGQLRGKVTLRQPDGNETPAAGAMIDVFRVDMAGKYSTKTDKNGEFVFAGLPYVGDYLLAASFPGAKPGVIANVKAGRDVDHRLMLEPGDGRRFTLEEAQTVAATTPAATAQVETPDQVVARAFKEGNLALITKNYDEAIKRFEEGLNAAPQQPALLVNLSRAFSSRGTENYSRAVAALGTRQMSRETRNAAQDDLRRAVEAAAQAVDLIKVQPIPENDDDRKRQETNRYFALNARYQSLRTLVTFDASQAEAALAAFQEYIEIEDDAPKKSRAELDAARMLLDSKNYGLCLEQYRQILVREPNEIEALAGLGLAIYRSGDRQRSAEAGGYLKRFIQEAPQSHELRPAVSEALRKLSALQ